MSRFSLPHALTAFAIFAVEVLIAVFIRDSFVRPHIGDLLVVCLLHFAVCAIFEAPPVRVALGVFIFACLVEASQAMHLIRLLGLQDSTAARLILGNTFQWMDVLAYAVGAIVSWRVDLSWFRKPATACQHGGASTGAE